MSTRITPDRSNSARAVSSGNGVEVDCSPATTVPCRAVDRDDRLGAPQPAREPGELAWVAERLQVHQDDVGVLVGLPVLQQVVAGDIGAAAGRDERRDADPAPGRLAQHGDAERTGLGEEPGPAGQRRERRERGVQRDGHVGVDDAEAVRPDHPHAVGARRGDDVALQGPAGGPLVGVAALAEPAAEDHQAAHAARGAVVHDLDDGGRGYGDHDEIERVGDVEHRPQRGHAADVARLGVDRVERAVEVAAQQVGEHRVADLARVVARADHCDRAGIEQPPDRVGLGALLALAHHLVGHRGRVDRELQGDLAVLEVALGLVPRLTEHPHHRGVLGEHDGDETFHAALATRGGQVLEQHRADTAALVVVGDDEGDLGLVRARAPARTVRRR